MSKTKLNLKVGDYVFVKSCDNFEVNEVLKIIGLRGPEYPTRIYTEVPEKLKKGFFVYTDAKGNPRLYLSEDEYGPTPIKTNELDDIEDILWRLL